MRAGQREADMEGKAPRRPGRPPAGNTTEYCCFKMKTMSLNLYDSCSQQLPLLMKPSKKVQLYCRWIGTINCLIACMYGIMYAYTRARVNIYVYMYIYIYVYIYIYSYTHTSRCMCTCMCAYYVYIHVLNVCVCVCMTTVQL